MADKDNGGCLSWIIILVLLGTIIGGIQECSNKHHKRQDIILPEYCSFKRTGDPEIYFETFDSQTYACLDCFWESGRSVSMYVEIKNGNELFDYQGTFCGYIIARKDGSFDIKGWDVAQGHYEGVDGAKILFFEIEDDEDASELKKESADVAQTIASDTYAEVMRYCSQHFIDTKRGSVVGFAKGDARFNFNLADKTIEVTYSVLNSITTEKGILSHFSIEKNCGLNDSASYYPISIQAKWTPESSGSGNMIVSFSHDNILRLRIIGDGNWEYWTEYKFSSPDEVLLIFNKALTEIYGESQDYLIQVPSAFGESQEDGSKSLLEEKDKIEEITIEDFISDFYLNRKYEDYAFIEEHCSPSLLKWLKDGWDYADCEGYCVWEFRSGEQDGPSDRCEIVSITQDGDWYTYVAYDMGILFSRKVKIIIDDGKIIIDDLRKIEDNLAENENRSVETISDTPDLVEEAIEEGTIPFNLVEEKPKFNGGDADEFSKWVKSRLVYPQIALEAGLKGSVTVQFTINEDGSVSDINVLRGVDSSLDNEAIRVVSSSPKWNPGKQRGRAVKVSYTISVIF